MQKPPELPPQPIRINTRADLPNPTASRGGIGDKAKHGETGTVVAYFCDTYMATVLTSTGRTVTLPRMRSSPGDVAHLEVGTEVLINNDYGAPFIMGILTHPAGVPSDGANHSITGIEGVGGNGLNQASTQTPGNYRLRAEPKDLIPGDWAHVGPDGNSVGVLAGGVNVMRSSSLSQFRTHQVDDTTEIISRNHRHITDMGFSETHNDNGSINYTFRGASDQRTESGPDEERWTIKLDMGAIGDVFNFELCTPQNQTLFKFHVNSDGQCEIFGLNGVSINSGSQNGGTSAEENTGDKVSSVGGNKTTTITGNSTETVKGSAGNHAYVDHETTAGNDIRSQALRDHAMSAGRHMYVSVQGSPIPGDAMVYDITSGNWVVKIGGPLSPDPLSAFDMQTYAGDMKFSSLLGGNFSVTSPLGVLESNTRQAVLSTNMLPDSVILGGNVLTSHLVKYEELALHLQELYSYFDTHIHTAGPMTAAGIPVVGTTLTPVVTLATVGLPARTTLFKSITTGVTL